MSSSTSTSAMPVLVMSDEQRAQAGEAWQAYNAMETTKQRHFDFLSLLERKKKNFNLDPTENDKILIEQLLKDHDEQVKQFTDASGRLKSSNPETHIALFTYIGKINELLDTEKVPH